MPTTSVDGLGSGIKWNDIIDAMVAADRASTGILERRKADIQAKVDGVRTFNSKLLSLQLDAANLNRPSLFNSRTATSSNESALSATASSIATPGTYTFDVVTMARSHQTAIAGVASATADLGAGTLGIQVGSGATATLNFAAGTTLDGVASSINGANLGVTATVVNSGVPTNPFRLILTSTATGTASALTITPGGALGANLGAFTTTQAAQDAEIKVGTGGTAVSVKQSTNLFKDVIPGITLTAKKDATTGINVTVGSNTDNAKMAVKSFLTAYNDLVQFLKDNASYDPTAKKAGVLFSESDIRSRFQGITSSLIAPVKNLPIDLATLGAVGITIDRSTSKLLLDETVLDAKLIENPTGVSKIFTNSGTSSDPGIRFAALTDKTDVTNPFTVDVTQVASQARAAGLSDLAPTTTITSINKDLKVTVNGREYALTLTERSYTEQELADHVQAVLDQKITNNADKVKVGLAANRLSITSFSYGSAATVQVDAASGANSVLGLETTKKFGADVQGRINGVFVNGTGQVLRGTEGTASEGLALSVTAGAALTGATVRVSKGLIQAVSERLKGLTDSKTGAFTIKEQALQSSIDKITSNITKADERLEQRRLRYTRQFQTMERLINQSNSLGNLLNGQIKGFENAAKSRAG
jgi:flagellar hook-associated protein 2